MFFYLSKILYYLIMPATLIGITLILALILRNKVWKRYLLITATFLFFLFTNDFTINALMTWWEIPPKPFSEVTDDYDVGIVLTGITNLQQTPRDRVYFQKGADRIIHALELYKRGKIKKILITGGTGSLTHPELTEANVLEKILELFGVPQNDIILETESRNTYENAIYSAKILNSSYKKGKYLLITSAFHMRRAKACFDKAGLNTETFSTDFYTFPITYTPDSTLIPNEKALDKWAILEREILGILMYKIAGYI